ncbi:acyltransferase family protein [Hydrogenophaga luteola]|uniref:Acyltransferase family protein n=1 Tax=Hydrogenophaga luteola TaxID=1591122 RepID=A0ABV7W5U6_9BURK
MPAEARYAPYRPDLDGLKAVAVVSVVLHQAFPGALSGGFAGIDVFFVVLGYLISSSVLSELQNPGFSLGSFYARRIRHLAPAPLLVLAAVLVAGWFLLAPADYRQLGQQVVAGSTFVPNLTAEPGSFAAGSASKPLLHLWPLTIWVPFCLLWPLAMWALHSWHMNAMRWTFAALLLSVLLLLAQDQTAAGFDRSAALLLSLLVGALLSTGHANVAVGHPNALAWIGATLLTLALMNIAPETAPAGWRALLPTLGTALLIAAGPSGWLNRVVLSSKPLVGIGLISYPLYLWHWPLQSFSHLKSMGEPGWERPLAWMALAFVLAWATHRFIEKPIRIGRMNGTEVIIALCVGLCLVTAAGFAIHRYHGFEQRVPDLVRHIMSTGGRSAVVDGWRDKECMLDYRLPPSHYKPFCIEQKRPLVFVWGDSHAGSLYPGFRALKESGRYEFGLAERTAAICPSVLGIEPRPLCRSLNDANIQAIRDTRPDIVILYSWWHNKRYDLRNLEATVEQIQQAGVPRIILLGAVPYWKKHLPQILLEEWKKGPVQARPPLRLGEAFLDPEVRNATEIMRERARKMGIEFISGMDFFCNAQGCLTRLSEDATQPLSYDYGHLSTGAAAFYIERLAPLMFSNTR